MESNGDPQVVWPSHHCHRSSTHPVILRFATFSQRETHSNEPSGRSFDTTPEAEFVDVQVRMEIAYFAYGRGVCKHLHVEEILNRKV